MPQNILLITPPFTQLNTPYPATAYIKGYLNTQAIEANQMDLGMDTILTLFSKFGLERLFSEVSEKRLKDASSNAKRIYRLRDSYIDSIDPVIQFLQDQDPTLAYLLCERNFLPEASKFDQLEDLEWAFGTMGIRDQARHLATLYLEDISDFIIELIDPHFGFSRYAERLGMSAGSFDHLYKEVQSSSSFICNIMFDILQQQIVKSRPTLVCLSVPFPGNLFAALKCGQWIKENHPDVKICMGGGYPNTELRSLTDPRVFEFVDFITLDDGETPLRNLISYLEGRIEDSMLKRTFMLKGDKVIYQNGSLHSDVKQEHVGTPDYTGLQLKRYLSVIQLTNPMHRLWSDGRWNKLTMAHGCYWGKCTFCDISLSYIKDYEASSAELIVDRMQELIEQTGERGFHFVDEAAPPALMKAVALEILKRQLVLNWWTNIRFEKSFTLDLCRLLSASGCIAVSGGLEVASDRLLELIAKGVTIEQVSQVNRNFNEAGIMVHAYLMYGFPTQTDQETVDSLEVVRQMFEQGILQSAFWHRFAMTAHSPVGLQPSEFAVHNHTGQGTFANNDLVHSDPTGADHDLYSEGLKASLYNYMHGVCLDYPLQDWFDHDIPATSLPADLISSFLAKPNRVAPKSNQNVVWLGGPIMYDEENEELLITTKQNDYKIGCGTKKGKWLTHLLMDIDLTSSIEICTYKEIEQRYIDFGFEDFALFWYGSVIEELKKIGLVLV